MPAFLYCAASAALGLVLAATLLTSSAIPGAKQASPAPAPASSLDSVINALAFRNLGPFRTAA